MTPNRTNANYIVYLVYAVALVIGWEGAMILAVNL